MIRSIKIQYQLRLLRQREMHFTFIKAITFTTLILPDVIRFDDSKRICFAFDYVLEIFYLNF